MALRVKLHGERTVMRWSILENEITYMDSRLSRGLATAHVRTSPSSSCPPHCFC